MSDVDMWDLPAYESYYSSLKLNTVYEFIFLNYNKPRMEHINKGKFDIDYLSWDVLPLKDYEDVSLYKQEKTTQHFPMKSFKRAIAQKYLKIRNQCLIAKRLQENNEVCDVKIIFERQQKTMLIQEFKVLDGQNENN